jgi:hypothetical protein
MAVTPSASVAKLDSSKKVVDTGIFSRVRMMRKTGAATCR